MSKNEPTTSSSEPVASEAVLGGGGDVPLVHVSSTGSIFNIHSQSEQNLFEAAEKERHPSISLLPQKVDPLAKSYWKKRTHRQEFLDSISEASKLIASFDETTHYRATLRVLLAILAVLNVIGIAIFFWLIPPQTVDGLDLGNNTLDETLGVAAADVERVKRNLLLGEGAMMLGFSLAGMILCILTWLSRYPKSCTACSCVPREKTGHVGMSFWRVFILSLVWIVHCPIGVALVEERVRMLNLVAFARLYAVVLSIMDLSPFKSSMMRVMSYYLRQDASTAAFIRWALATHKFKVLLPTLFVSWFGLALIYSLVEQVKYADACWYVIVTYSTVGYGDFFPVTLSGRVVGVVAMSVGLVIVAYLISEINAALQQPAREKLVFDSLNYAQGRAKVLLAARLVLIASFRLSYARAHLADEKTLKILKRNLDRASNDFSSLRHQIDLSCPDCLKTDNSGNDNAVTSLENAIWMQAKQVQATQDQVKLLQAQQRESMKLLKALAVRAGIPVSASASASPPSSPGLAPAPAAAAAAAAAGGGGRGRGRGGGTSGALSLASPNSLYMTVNASDFLNSSAAATAGSPLESGNLEQNASTTTLPDDDNEDNEKVEKKEKK